MKEHGLEWSGVEQIKKENIILSGAYFVRLVFREAGYVFVLL